MSRSVDYLTGAQIVVYKSVHDLPDDEWAFSDFLEDIEYQLIEMIPSLSSVKDCWDGRETHIILENGLCEIGVSEYMGLVSISIRPKEEGNDYSNITGIATKWIESIRPKFEKIGDLVKIGTFSNGEAMFRRVEDKQLISSKEGVCQWA